MEYVLVGCRSLIVLVFVVSAASKLRGRRAYAEFVAATGRLSPRPVAATTVRRLAATTLAAELAVVPLLLVPVTVPAGLAVAVGLLLAFTGAILAALRRGERAPCHCFGASEQPLGYAQVVRNLVLLAVVAGAVIASLVIVADDIAALFRA